MNKNFISPLISDEIIQNNSLSNESENIKLLSDQIGTVLNKFSDKIHSNFIDIGKHLHNLSISNSQNYNENSNYTKNMKHIFSIFYKLLKKHNFQLVVIPSMRTPLNTIHYAKEFFGENHTIIMDVDKKAYLSALGLSENIVVTCDSSSMISEAALTGKPIYVANILPKRNDKRFQNFRNLFRELNIIRNLGEEIENWNYEKLDETNRVAKILKSKIQS